MGLLNQVVPDHFGTKSVSSARPQTELLRQEIGLICTKEPFSSDVLIDALCQVPKLKFLFAQSARILEGYSIGEHTEMVIDQYERYFSESSLPENFTKADMRLMLALHDIGKSIPATNDLQHHETLAVLDSVRELLPCTDDAFNTIKAVVSADTIGKLIKKIFNNASADDRRALQTQADSKLLSLEDIECYVSKTTMVGSAKGVYPDIIAAANEISDRARKTSLDAKTFLRINCIFYQADTSSYTYDALRPNGRRAYPSLEGLYELNCDFSPNNGESLFASKSASELLRFRGEIFKVVRLLDELLSSSGQDHQS